MRTRSPLLIAAMTALMLVATLLIASTAASGADVPRRPPCTITGTNGPDTLVGTPGPDVI